MERIIKNTDYTDLKMKNSIRALTKQYPFIKSFSIGQSCMGREISAIKIGKSSDCILFVGGFKGSEAITSALLLRFAEELCDGIKNSTSVCSVNIEKIMEQKSLIIVPRINPDGCEISLCGAAASGAYVKQIRRLSQGDTLHWDANLRGVEINRNFSCGWYRDKTENGTRIVPSKANYGGAYPESEPETAALIGLCSKVNILRAVSFGINGRVIYSDFGDKISEKSEKLTALMSQVSGYRVNEIPFCFDGSFEKWFAKTYQRPSISVKIGDMPSPVDSINTSCLFEEVQKLMLISLVG
ncbi:MAG: M14 family zinc carboxypeptidase [Acutalibacteraceae bacterium]|nr:M14 family zinc carboxypeptidase [Acutalibacteraceae bacterium]